MYARQPSEVRLPRNVRIPRNYSGNAFRQEEEPVSPSAAAEAILEPSERPDIEVEPVENLMLEEENAPSEKTTPTAPAGKLLSSPGFRLDLGRFLNREKGGIGLEELLIIGLIFLLSQNETKDDLIFLLLLLLFIQ